MAEKKKKYISTRDLIVFSMLGSLMFISKVLMEGLPNVHLLGMLTMAYTVVYRKRALIPIYVYVLLNGLYAGFATWWLPYLYLWTVLWGVTMLLPQKMPVRIAVIVYPVICAAHGMAFGTLYAPAQALLYGLSWKAMVAWIVAGLPFDAIHAGGNFVAGMLVQPVVRILRRLEGQKN
jgi:energy-coupling factor transport system substrate-specific component